jgi:tRNA modification GTPase
VVAAVFRAPRSYTREDVVEISCHGGRLPAERVLAALLHAGARLARPGEFTLRAFLNGRLDLAQAEAVADLIHAETRAGQELALSQLAGDLSRRLDGLSDRLSDALAEVEARVDFAEDVGGVEVPAHVVSGVAGVSSDLAGLLAGAPYARAVREGLRVVLVGRPNVGKSSLFNALLGEERAIVTPLPGTTRDLVSERIEVAGVPVTLVDTAGWRAGGDAVEAIGVGRARAAAEEARVALWVVDRAAPLEDEDRRIAACLAGKRVLVALNKSDQPAVLEQSGLEPALGALTHEAIEVSATTGLGLGRLRAALGRLLGVADERPALAAAVANPRHIEALERARDSLARATGAAQAGLPGEIVALELRAGLSCLGEVTGRTLGDDLLDRIFSRFCVGK